MIELGDYTLNVTDEILPDGKLYVLLEHAVQGEIAAGPAEFWIDEESEDKHFVHFHVIDKDSAPGPIEVTGSSKQQLYRTLKGYGLEDWA